MAFNSSCEFTVAVKDARDDAVLSPDVAFIQTALLFSTSLLAATNHSLLRLVSSSLLLTLFTPGTQT